MAADIESELKAENQRLRDEITELKGITEPGKKYFHATTASPLPSTWPSPKPSPSRTSRATRCRPSS
eukprot:5666725-Pleurochrysis_carterae.AAC.1